MIDSTKEFLETYYEAEIEQKIGASADKEYEKKQMRNWFDATAQGIKDELRAQGRLIG